MPPPFDYFSEDDFIDDEVFDDERGKRTKSFNFSDFSGIEIGGGTFTVEIVCADSYSITVNANERLFRNIGVSKDGDTLQISHSRHIGWRAQLNRPKVRITLPILKYLKLSGATKAIISGFKSSEEFHLKLSGASRVHGEIATGNVELELSGASHARLTGSAKDVIVKTSGANHLDLSDFSAQNAAVKLSGASHVTVKIAGKLDARLSGASRLGYVGNPVMGDIRTSGASRISRVE